MRLSLIIRKVHFDAIKSGVKKKEYRDISPRLTRQICYLDNDGKDKGFKPIKELMLYNGYRKDRPSMLVECTGISIEEFQNTGDYVYVFSLGKILSIKP